MFLENLARLDFRVSTIINAWMGRSTNRLAHGDIAQYGPLVFDFYLVRL